MEDAQNEEINRVHSNRAKPPGEFFFRAEGWTAWSRRYERYRKVANLTALSEEDQVNHLIYTLGDIKAEDIFESFNLEDDLQRDYNTVWSCFGEYFVAKRNVIYERALFNMRKQKPDEMVEEYITSLYTLSKYCEFGTLREDMIRDRIVVGLLNEEISKELQIDPKLTFEKAQNRANMAERVKKQQVIIRPEGYNVEGITRNRPKYAVKRYEKPRNNVKGKTFDKSFNNNRCRRCGKTYHRVEECPAREVKCFKCTGKGHYARMCESKTKVCNEKQVNYCLGQIINETCLNNNKSIFLDIYVNDVLVKFKIDTGAQVTILPENLSKTIPGLRIKQTFNKLYGPGKYPLKVIGSAWIELKFKDKNIKQEVYITDSKEYEALLGLPAIEELKIINFVGKIDMMKPFDVNIVHKYTKLFKGLVLMDKPYNIKLMDNVKPHAITVPRRIAIPLRDKVKKELLAMEKAGVITKINEPTEWCAGMVPMQKPNGQVRNCVDLQSLNQCIVRERHVMPKVEETLAMIGTEAKIFSKLDAKNGFWQIGLTPETAKLTTFITPFRRFYFNRLPFGITSAPEHYQRRIMEVLQGVEGVASQLDDILIWGRDENEHDARLHKVLSILEKVGITLNRDKCQFKKHKVKFLGEIITDVGIESDPEKVEAITQFDPPNSRKDVRVFLGMVNQLLKYVPNVSNITKPIRDLLSTKVEWSWGIHQQEAFENIKKMLSCTPILARYDPNLEIRITTDSSSYGIGGVLEQKQSSGEWKPIMYASRSLSQTEQRYAQIEKEALAITCMCERFSDYITGIKIEIVTDHKPLIAIMGSKTLDAMTARLQRFKMRLMRFDYGISYKPGKQICIADALSRYPLKTKIAGEDILLEKEVAAYVNQIMQEIPCSKGKLKVIEEEQDKDCVLKKIKNFVIHGWPSKQRNIGPYHKWKDSITLYGNLLMKNNQIIIPNSLKPGILEKFQEGHLGITKCQRRARESVWWPGITREIRELIASCSKCIEVKANRVEPLISTVLPKYPWEQVAADIFMVKGVNYMVLQDYFSRYPEVSYLKNLTSGLVIEKVKAIFGRFGIPEIFRADNGTQFDSAEFRNFAKEYGFKLITSSPKYPKSNGFAESGVKSMKKIIKTSKDPILGLLAYRTAPLEMGPSPAELLMGRRLRTTIPTIEANLQPKWPNMSKYREKDENIKKRQKHHYDRRHRTKDLTDLKKGDRVWIPNRNNYGTVMRKLPEPRSYEVKTGGRIIRRNRSHLIPNERGIEEKIMKIPVRDETEKIRKNPVYEETERVESKASYQANHATEPEVTGDPIVRTRSGRVIRPPERLDL